MKAREFSLDEVKMESDAEWTGSIVKGENKMPGYDRQLSDVGVKDVVAYIHRLVK
jgi:mono/diheme cytochrome c family protein